MTDELLLRRLRIGWHDDDTPIWVSDAMTEAAARIEQLTAERERLGCELNVARYGQPDFAWSVHLAAMAELQAERDHLAAVQPDDKAMWNAAIREAGAAAWVAESGDGWTRGAATWAILDLIDKPAHVNETPKSEHGARDVLTPATKGGA